MRSSIENLNRAEIRTDPFPHIVKRNALDPALFQELVSEFPNLDQFPGNTDGSNIRLTLPICDAANSEHVTPLWHDFLKAHADRDHLLGWVDLFSDQIKSHYPAAAKFVDNAEKLSVGVKGQDATDKTHVTLSSSIDANTPVTDGPTSVRGPHVDNPTKLLVALLYLRDESESEGGDLQLYRLKPGRSLEESVLPGCHFRDEAVEHVSTVRYEPNTLFVWMNSAQSIHGVSPR